MQTTTTNDVILKAQQLPLPIKKNLQRKLIISHESNQIASRLIIHFKLKKGQWY